ncbi:MAG TPA: hypothetical protein VN428_00780 [Bryobacteraceae bacterium]|nr:hypothetical protein [Bryobacteraceae bacterium]
MLSAEFKSFGTQANSLKRRNVESPEALAALEDWINGICEAGRQDDTTNVIKRLLAAGKLHCHTVSVQSVTVCVYGCGDPSASAVARLDLVGDPSVREELAGLIAGWMCFVKVKLDGVPQLMWFICSEDVAASLGTAIEQLQNVAVRPGGAIS